MSLPLVQFKARPGIIDLAWGHPDPTLLPVEELRLAADRAARTWGPDLLAYGHPRGPGPLIQALADHLGSVDGRAPDPASIVITAGASHALDLVTTLFARPGDRVLVESPTYHIALRVMADHGLVPAPVPGDHEGPDVEALERILEEGRPTGRAPAMLYTIPTYHNPTGRLMSLARRQALVDLAERHGLLLVEDDAYRELSYGDPPPPSLWSLAPPGRVIRLGSFSKSLAPGLRLGYLLADPALAGRVVDGGLLDSGGGIAHYQALIVADFVATGAYARHLDRLRSAFRERRDRLVSALVERLPPDIVVPRPEGGFFIWLTLPPSRTSAEVLAASEPEGVSFVPGPAFSPEPGFERNLRLSFSRYGPDELAEAAARLARAMGEFGSH